MVKAKKAVRLSGVRPGLRGEATVFGGFAIGIIGTGQTGPARWLVRRSPELACPEPVEGVEWVEGRSPVGLIFQFARLPGHPAPRVSVNAPARPNPIQKPI